MLSSPGCLYSYQSPEVGHSEDTLVFIEPISAHKRKLLEGSLSV